MAEKEIVLRLMRSLLLGMLLGTAVGLFFGWVQFPAGGRSSALNDLAQTWRDEYIAMVAAGYAFDADIAGAAQRLSRVHADLAGPGLRQTIDRIITTSARDLDDIYFLVALARDLGQLSATMRPFLASGEGGA